jgi:ElaB/YqjD/DUF883 family membrane-anchored ribosome-binding protein
MKSELEYESEKSPEQIEREIDAQRASIGNIVDRLESRFTPGQMIDQAWGMMQDNGSTFITNLGTSVRNNPVPAVLTSVGLLWMMLSQNRPPVPQPVYRSGPDQDRMGEWADGLADGIDSAKEHLHQTTDSLKEGYQSVKDKAAHLSDNVGAAKENLSQALHGASDRLTRNTEVLGQQFSSLLKEQPLMVAAAGIALGALIGAAIPTTATEQRYMGRTSAGLLDKVKQQAQEGYETVRDTVTKTTEHREEAGGAGQEQHTANGSADFSRGPGVA